MDLKLFCNASTLLIIPRISQDLTVIISYKIRYYHGTVINKWHGDIARLYTGIFTIKYRKILTVTSGERNATGSR